MNGAEFARGGPSPEAYLTGWLAGFSPPPSWDE